jgi:tripartite-type tricarboxylate transporter receptor subunit TctC
MRLTQSCEFGACSCTTPRMTASGQQRLCREHEQHVRSTRASRPLTTAMRWEGLPDIPTVGDFVPGYEASSMLGVGAPKNTPAEIINKLNREINAGLVDSKLKALFTDLGGTVILGSPVDYGRLLADETEKWGKVIRAANIKPE